MEKEDYLMAMERSPVKDIEIKIILKVALTKKVNDKEICMRSIGSSYYYEGFNQFRMEDLISGLI